MLWSVVLAACLATTLAQGRFQRQGRNECQSGPCQLLKDCPPVITLLEKAKRDKTLLTNLRSLVCGFDKDQQTKVCCPVNDSDENIKEDSVLPSDSECGISANMDYERIVGGNPASLNQWPWMAALGYRAKRGDLTKVAWLCGGALITRRYVITAAHCLTNAKFILEKVRLGDLDLNDAVDDGATPIERFIEKAIPHEDYRAVNNDIAIIKLDRPVTFNSQIQPICLPTAPQLRASLFERRSPFVIGWGSTEFRGPGTTHLQQVQFPVVNNTMCGEIFKKHNQVITGKQICAGELDGGKDSCVGDSGGPLMIPYGSELNFYHIGIVSFGYKCGEVGYPGVYTRTTEYIDWISENIKI